MKKIVFVLSVLALTGSVVISCNKHREEVCTKNSDVKKDTQTNAITKKNLAESGKFVLVKESLSYADGRKIRDVKPGEENLEFYREYVFKENGEYVLSIRDNKDSELSTQTDKYELDGNKITIYGKDEKGAELKYELEIVEFVKGKFLKIQDKYSEIDPDTKKEENLVNVSEYEVR